MTAASARLPRDMPRARGGAGTPIPVKLLRGREAGVPNSAS
jgi:hypothetical protein